VKRVIVGLCVIAALIALVLLRDKVKEKLEDPDSLTLTEADLAVVRRLPVMWSPVESGAPAVYDLSKKTLPVPVETYRRAMRAAEILIQLGELAPGRYEYDNPLDPEDLATQPFVVHRRVEVKGNRVAVDVTREHLALMRVANTGIIDDGGRDIGVEMDPKRPYGDMTYFELDMATTLGIVAEGPPRKDDPAHLDFSEPQLRRFDELHEQMEPVLQVFLGHAMLAPGVFVRNPKEYGRWHRVTP
jgi:hypothetical protein